MDLRGSLSFGKMISPELIGEKCTKELAIDDLGPHHPEEAFEANSPVKKIINQSWGSGPHG